MKRKKRPSHELSSGNVFADVGLPEKFLAKAELVAEIDRIISQQGLTQEQVARKLGIDQPRVSALLRGKLNLFSLERIMELLAALGNKVEIRIASSPIPSFSVVRSGSHEAYGTVVKFIGLVDVEPFHETMPNTVPVWESLVTEPLNRFVEKSMSSATEAIFFSSTGQNRVVV